MQAKTALKNISWMTPCVMDKLIRTILKNPLQTPWFDSAHLFKLKSIHLPGGSAECQRRSITLDD